MKNLFWVSRRENENISTNLALLANIARLSLSFKKPLKTRIYVAIVLIVEMSCIKFD